MATSLTSPATGRVLDGRYEVGRLVARGGMATVYEGFDTRLERRVAIKVMHPALATDQDFVARFIREARIAARVHDPNVVAVFDQGSDGDTVFLAMEYVEGATLRDLLRMRGRLTPRDAVAILEQVLSALGAAHRSGLVHRDVKPENVLLTEDGQVKVADFGLARAITSGASSSAMTTGVIMGTVSYLAPEQVERGVADARSDVYAAGIMLYEMLTGEKPFVGGTPLEIAYRHVHETVPDPSSVVPEVPATLDRFVRVATARDPDDRPPDAAAMLNELRRVRTSEDPDRQPNGADVEHTLRDLVRTHTPNGDHAPLATAEVPEIGRRARSARSAGAGEPAVRLLDVRRRRWRGTALLCVVVLVAVVAAIGAWWFADGRFTTAPAIVPGTTQSAAADTLDAAGLVPSFTPTFSETIAEGRVVRAEIEAGERVLHGSTIAVQVSKGPERFEVPDLAGRTADIAADELDDVPVKLGDPKLEYSETVPDGEVIRTEPAAGSAVRRGTVITPVVSNGPKPIPIPNVVGQPLDEAQATLDAAGFTVAMDGAVFSDDVAEGAVVSQTPSGGTAFRDAEVRLVASKGPPFVTVPDVRDSTEAEAVAKLRAAGFDVSVGYPFGDAFIDRVVTQSPGAGEQARRGATITIQVV